jgi:hypothetical protein
MAQLNCRPVLLSRPPAEPGLTTSTLPTRRTTVENKGSQGTDASQTSAATDQNRLQITPSAGLLSTLKNQWIRIRIAA